MANTSQCYNSTLFIRNSGVLWYTSVTQECTTIVSNTPVLVPGTHEVTLLADLDLVTHHCPKGQHYTLFPSPTAPSSVVFYYSSMCQPGLCWTLCIAFLILWSGQLSQPRATAHSWNRLIWQHRDIPASLVVTGPSLCSTATGSCSCQRGNLGSEAAAHVWFREEITWLTSRKLPYNKQPVVNPLSLIWKLVPQVWVC